jgi:hypothetical protein
MPILNDASNPGRHHFAVHCGFRKFWPWNSGNSGHLRRACRSVSRGVKPEVLRAHRGPIELEHTAAFQAPAAAHLAAFVRSASADVIDDLWSSVGRAVARRRAAKPDPVWISTAGLGVYWLHVRLDDRPKYYRHRAFTDPSA